MPFSRSRSPESMIRSATPASSWCAVKAPAWWSIASTSVVLPWSTCATMATFLRSERVEGMAVRRRFRRRGLTPDPSEARRSAPHRRSRSVPERDDSGDAALHAVRREADAVATLTDAQRHERVIGDGHGGGEPDPVAQAVLAGAVALVLDAVVALGERGELGGDGEHGVASSSLVERSLTRGVTPPIGSRRRVRTRATSRRTARRVRRARRGCPARPPAPGPGPRSGRRYARSGGGGRSGSSYGVRRRPPSRPTPWPRSPGRGWRSPRRGAARPGRPARRGPARSAAAGPTTARPRAR